MTDYAPESFASMLEDSIYSIECTMGSRPAIIRMRGGYHRIEFEGVRLYLTLEQRDRLLAELKTFEPSHRNPSV